MEAEPEEAQASTDGSQAIPSPKVASEAPEVGKLTEAPPKTTSDITINPLPLTSKTEAMKPNQGSIQGQVSTEDVERRKIELIKQLNIESLDTIDQDIQELRETIETERRTGADVAEMQDYLTKLNELRLINEKLQCPSQCRPKSKAELLKRELAELLQEVGITEEVIEEKLQQCIKKLKILTRMKKSNEELQPVKILESQLLRLQELRNKILENRSESTKSEAHQINYSISLVDPISKEVILFDYDPNLRRIDVMSLLSIDQSQRWELQFRQSKSVPFRSLQDDLTIGQLIAPTMEMEVQLVKRHLVKCLHREEWIMDGTDIEKVKKIMKAQGYVCFNEKFEVVEKEQLHENIMLLECQECKVSVYGQIPKSRSVPLTTILRETSKYISFAGLDHLEISTVKVDGNWRTAYQEKTLFEQFQGKVIEEIRMAYTIDLEIEISTLQGNRHIDSYPVSSDIPLRDIKMAFESECKLKSQFQKWIVGERELDDDNQTLEALEFSSTRYNVDVVEVRNLEYYGFSSLEKIQVQSFREFYIENDHLFKTQLQESNFPSPEFEASFRVMALGVIFAAVKKHCRIQSAITSITHLVSNSTKPVMLWTAKSADEVSYFKEQYALHNILHSGDDDLKIEFMRVYKSHSPLPLISRTGIKKFEPFFEHHFWISNKSFVIISMEVSEVVGKSAFLNLLFGTDFEKRPTRHPACNNSVDIQYNVYRNDSLLVDVIDVSSFSLPDEAEKKNLAICANLLIIHFLKPDEEKTREWVRMNCSGIPVIYIQRDTSGMVPHHFNATLKANSEKKTGLQYSIPELSQKNVSYYTKNFNLSSIFDQIHSVIRWHCEDPSSEQLKWKFSEFLSRGDEGLARFVSVLKEIELNFSHIVDTDALLKSGQDFSVKHPISKTMQRILKEINFNNADRALSKLRESIRLVRARRLSVFDQLSDLENLLESRNNDTMKQSTHEVCSFFDKMSKIPEGQTTAGFRKVVQEFMGLNKSALEAEPVRNMLAMIRESLTYDIKPQEFSIENFWREVAYQTKNSKGNTETVRHMKRLYTREFASGKSFQVINGETLEMPIDLLRSNLPQFPQNKKIMVVGIFGPQSSGKSTLLNFLFGCDFLSSEGRCTSGIYGTYYDINNYSIHGCQGIFLLDTEGLFSNYTNQRCKNRSNFDNKLVLFLLKTCDLLIMNTRGDVDGKCTNILELAFDCELMEHKNGSRYPNFYIVLNQSSGQMSQQQRIEVQVLRDKILEVAPHMKEYLTSNESNSMPLAFNTSDQQYSSKILSQIQQTNRVPTQRFYECTRDLCGKLISLLKKRGSCSQGRTLDDIYDHMSRIWTTILKIKMLTKYSSRKLKEFDASITNWKYKRNTEVQELISEFKLRIPSDLRYLKEWEATKERELETRVELIMQALSNEYPENNDPEKDKMIKAVAQELKPRLMSYFGSLKSEIESVRYKLQLIQSKNRGLDQFIKAAQELRQLCIHNKKDITNKEKNAKFEEVWKAYTDSIRKKFDRKSSAEETYKELRDVYEKQLKSYGKIIMISASAFELNFLSTFGVYVNETSKIIKEYETANRLQQKYGELTICTTRTGPTDVTFKYLDMRQFFEFEPCRIQYYFPPKIHECIDPNQIREHIEEKFRLNPEIQEFVRRVQNDLCYFHVKVIDLDQQVARRLLNIVLTKKKEGNFQFNQLIYSSAFQIREAVNNFLLRCHQNKQPYELQYLVDAERCLRKGIMSLCAKQPPKHAFHQLVSEAIKTFIVSIGNNRLEQLVFPLFKDLDQLAIYSLRGIGLNLKSIQLEYITNNWVPDHEDPIKIKHLSQLTANVNSLPSIFNKSKIKQLISEYPGDYSIPIAVVDTERIKVGKDFAKEGVLKHYMNKQYSELVDGIKTPAFKKFIHKYIQYDNIIKFIVDTVESLPETISIENSVEFCIINLNKQLGDFNKDLLQISQSLFYLYTSHLHDFCLHLLWKWHHERIWKKRERELDELETERDSQYNTFMGYLDMNDLRNSEGNAGIFVKKYREFLRHYSNEEKKKYLGRTQTEFFKKYPRAEVQRLVDVDMAKCNKQTACQYLEQPQLILRTYYRNLIKTEVEHLQANFENKSIACIRELESRISDIEADVKGDDENWFSERLFQKVQKAPAKAVKQIFMTLMKTGKAINSDTYNKQYTLKPQVNFRLKQRLNEEKNIEFFQLHSLEDVEIRNYSMFLSSLLQQLKKGREKTIDLAITKEDKIAFGVQVDLILCPSKCVCCRRLCDIDMRVDPHHKVHRCTFGHQMRAISGVRVEKRREGRIKYYASVMRCEDVEPMSVFLFNNEEIKWKDFCDRKKGEWDFSNSQIVSENQRIMFGRLWSLAGKEICKKRSKQDKQEMIFLQYDKAAIEFSQGNQPETHYVLAIDGSGSMSSNNKWADQLTSLKQILVDLSSSDRNRVSIIVFTDDPLIICENKSASEINVNTIKQPGGASDKEAVAAFSGANSIMTKYADVMNLHFVYISDGHGVHPTDQITEMLAIRKKANENGNSFKYASILIGGDLASSGMGKIQEKLPGESRWVKSATEISSTFREILNVKPS